MESAWNRIAVAVVCGLLSACGSGSGASNTDAPAAANTMPDIAGAPPTTAEVNQPYVFVPTATDADGDVLTFQIDNRPDWATFSATTGRLEGIPPSNADTVYEDVTIGVSDGAVIDELPPFDIVVEGVEPPPVNTAPTISGTPTASIATGNTYDFTPTAADADGDVLGFTVTNLPAWAEFDAGSGRVTGTPAIDEVGTYAGIAITVSDGQAQAALAVFTIEVTEGSVPGPDNQSPTITGNPALSVLAGNNYRFRPSASDPDGDALSFSVTNKPSWVNFNTSTGCLCGTPDAADVGVYADIVITVTDGVASASLPGFTLTVDQVVLGSATISWTPPTENADDSALTNLAGYRIYYGTDAGDLSQSVTFANAGITSGIVENLAQGTWYFAVKAYNSSAIESALSNVTSKTIN